MRRGTGSSSAIPTKRGRAFLASLRDGWPAIGTERDGRHSERRLLAQVLHDDRREFLRGIRRRDNHLDAGRDRKLPRRDIHRQALVGRPVGVLQADAEPIHVANRPQPPAAVDRLVRADEGRQQQQVDLAGAAGGRQPQLRLCTERRRRQLGFLLPPRKRDALDRDRRPLEPIAQSQLLSPSRGLGVSRCVIGTAACFLNSAPAVQCRPSASRAGCRWLTSRSSANSKTASGTAACS